MLDEARDVRRVASTSSKLDRMRMKLRHRGDRSRSYNLLLASESKHRVLVPTPSVHLAACYSNVNGHRIDTNNTIMQCIRIDSGGAAVEAAFNSCQ